MIFDNHAAESIQKMVVVAKQNMVDYTTITAEIAETTVELMKFYVDTKKLLYGFPLIIVPPTDHMTVGASASQEVINNGNDSQGGKSSQIDFHSNQSVVSSCSFFSQLSSTSHISNHSTLNVIMEKILLFKNQSVSSSRIAKIIRVSSQTILISAVKIDFYRILSFSVLE